MHKTRLITLDETQARWLSDLSRAANNYKNACMILSSNALREFDLVTAGTGPSNSLSVVAMQAQMFYGSLTALLTQKWSVFLIADLDENTKMAAIDEINQLVNIALGPANTKSIKSLDGFTWFKRGFTLDNF